MNIKQLQEHLKSLLAKSEAIRGKYNGTEAQMTSTEEQEWTNILDEADSVSKQIDNLGKEEKLAEFARKTANALPAGDGGLKNDKGTAETKGDLTPAEAGRKAFRKFLSGGHSSLTEQDKQAIGMSTSIKAYQSDNPAGGGFLVTPQELASEIITLLKDLVFMRGLARTFEVARAESFGVPAVDTDPSDADWTSELAVGNEETTMAMGKRELKPSPLAKYIKESNKLLRQVPDIEALVLDRLGYKLGITEEKGFLVGTGANQPLGVFTPSAAGISTNRDVQSAGVAVIAADDLIETVFALKAGYRKNARWILNRTILKLVRKLKDANNNYIWSTAMGPGTGFQGTPGTLLDLPYCESEYAPNTVASNGYVAILGDFSNYFIVDALDMQMQVVDQLFALNNQTGYILRKETDGMPVKEEAFSRLILK